MKTLYLVRHAKSSWKDASLRDRDRPLNKRGKRDAPRMADVLKEKVNCPDVFVSSPSRRTQDTAVSFLHVYGKLIADLELEEALFHGDEGDMASVIGRLDNGHQSAMLFVHNPGITDYANELAKVSIFNIPTCGVAAISLDTDCWSEVGKCPAEMLFYYYPKGLDLQF
ncbi:histidine phosphatase family protein [Reichenbachiella carrageenanivorans]|uniref:Histidine phosphatase family protein n=1 Tax=Reichenbachiella carrageenanivorans TaxID=2979869 RepID=A0ABY6D5I1_9BACT|nr:histidine phosphatase family protein [Reichenbachiella carrageenanivorans]UXX79100.1 histidine phosphatase family protein [Reichenbachiella carrageenanivorans]